MSRPVEPPELSTAPTLIPQDRFLELSGACLRDSATDANLALKRKVDVASIRLGQICYCITGVVAHDPQTGESKERLISATPKNEWYRPYVEAKEWDGRYSWVESSRYIEYRPNVPGHMHRPKFPELFDSPKIFVQGIAGPRLVATLDTRGIIANHSLNCCVKIESVLHLGDRLNLSDADKNALAPDVRYDLRYILAVVSSRLVGFYHAAFLSPGTSVFPETLRMLPVRRIDFDSARGMDLTSHLTDLLEGRVSASEAREWIGRLAPGIRDKAIHDALSNLAARMIDTHRRMQDERRGFFAWLKQETGLDVSRASGRKSLLTYEDTGFESFLSQLARNHADLRVDPHSRSVQERLRQEYAASAAKMLALRREAERMDGLIDELVYSLYGLSREEANLVGASKVDF